MDSGTSPAAEVPRRGSQLTPPRGCDVVGSVVSADPHGLHALEPALRAEPWIAVEQPQASLQFDSPANFPAPSSWRPARK
jgi:hypothetical protein